MGCRENKQSAICYKDGTSFVPAGEAVSKKKKSKLAELCIKAAENVRGEPKPAFCSPRKNHSNFLRPVDAKTTDIVPE